MQLLKCLIWNFLPNVNGNTHLFYVLLHWAQCPCLKYPVSKRIWEGICFKCVYWVIFTFLHGLCIFLMKKCCKVPQNMKNIFTKKSENMILNTNDFFRVPRLFLIFATYWKSSLPHFICAFYYFIEFKWLL